jgi:hypothetical protein
MKQSMIDHSKIGGQIKILYIPSIYAKCQNLDPLAFRPLIEIK